MSGDISFSINPIEFFAISADCCYLSPYQYPSLKSHSLPSTHSLTGEESFAKVALGWNEEGIAAYIEVSQPVVKSLIPQVERGDSVELFIDTRDLKSTGFNTRFCHHFFFLPQFYEELNKGEKTHFRTEDSHSLCDPQLLVCETQLKKNGYQMKVFIPSQCLHGYDPKQFKRLGFTYRINRYGGESQHFSVISADYQIDQQPSLWGSLILTK